MNTPVSFELAKLLEKKGFDEVCQQWYSVEGGLYYQDEFDNNRGFIPVCECETPTIAEVVMWLYEKHKIWIGVICDVGNDLLFTFKIYSTKIGEERCIVNGNMYESPTEAHEAAIKYTLINNLI